jgi:hypothetical protein
MDCILPQPQPQKLNQTHSKKAAAAAAAARWEKKEPQMAFSGWMIDSLKDQ